MMARTPYPQSDRELMRLIERSPGHRAGYKQLIRELGLGGGRERRLLLEQLARITARGELVIPPNEINGAMQGDEVLVDEAPPGRDGRRSGRVARVLNRRNPTVVGIFHYAKTHRRSAGDNAPLINGNYITPVDEGRAGSPGGGAILIPEGGEVPSTSKETPHRVLGEEAQAQQAHWSDEVDPHS